MTMAGSRSPAGGVVVVTQGVVWIGTRTGQRAEDTVVTMENIFKKIYKINKRTQLELWPLLECVPWI